MNKLNRLKLFCIALGIVFSTYASAQNMETMLVEKMENGSLVFPEKCTPEDMIIIINSSLTNLEFESNLLPDEDFIVTYNEQNNQYIICHEKIRFKLTVSGANLQSEDIEIFDLDKPQAYRVSANMAKGTVNILTNPRNATVSFPDLNNLILSTNQPITNVSGKYRVQIAKAQYVPLDTMIVIPRDAEKTYNFDLVPLFSSIQLDLKTDNNSTFLKAPVLWIDSARIELESFVKTGSNPRSFFDQVEYLKLYEGNIIPIPDGTRKIRIEAEGFLPYKTTIQAKEGKMHMLSVSLEPIFGYLTLIDKQLAEGASILLNDQVVGNVPLFKLKARVGTHVVRFEKPGFITLEKQYKVIVQENQNTDLEVLMVVAKNIRFESEPSNAEVLLEGKRIGFTPFTTIVHAGNHRILVRKNDFASEKSTKLVNELTPDEETVQTRLRPAHPLSIRSEKDNLLIHLKGTNGLENIEIDSTVRTPAHIPLPYGKYKISLTNEKGTVYKSKINHAANVVKRGKLPNYSRSSFIALSGYYEDQNNYEASFGKILLFPRSGLSTALISVDYNSMEVTNEAGSFLYKTLTPGIFLSNWDWRLGGSLLRQVDVNLLGRAKYSPGLKILSKQMPFSDFMDVEMQKYFYGFEVSTRLSYFNICFRYGRQINIGKANLWDETEKKYSDVSYPINENRNTASIGISLNGKVYKSNQMLRLWHRPLFNPATRRSTTPVSKTSNAGNK